MWPRELLGKARNWYVSRFAALPAFTFPPWVELYAAVLLAYTSCIKGQEPIPVGTSTVPRGYTGKEALEHRRDELVMLLRRTGETKQGE